MSKKIAHEIGPYHVWATSRKKAIEALREHLHIKLDDELIISEKARQRREACQ